MSKVVAEIIEREIKRIEWDLEDVVRRRKVLTEELNELEELISERHRRNYCG